MTQVFLEGARVRKTNRVAAGCVFGGVESGTEGVVKRVRFVGAEARHKYDIKFDEVEGLESCRDVELEAIPEIEELADVVRAKVEESVTLGAGSGSASTHPVSTPPADGGGLRYNAEKIQPELLPLEWYVVLAQITSKGARKYAPRNWERGMKWSIMMGCAIRHMWKWLMGERHDPETGCHHLGMVAWNILGLMSYDLREIGENDLPEYLKLLKHPTMIGDLDNLGLWEKPKTA